MKNSKEPIPFHASHLSYHCEVSEGEALKMNSAGEKRALGFSTMSEVNL